jgi:Ala-tRNA(Pro) deacylase
MTPGAPAYNRLLALFAERGVPYRLIMHAPEGRTEIVSALRGHPVAHAAKCLIIMAKIGKKVTRYILAVVPGDARVDFGALKAILGATYVAVASAEVATELGRTEVGTILPFPLDDRLELIADPRLLEQPALFFNAGRLDCSVTIAPDDYARVARPRIAAIAAPNVSAPSTRNDEISSPRD